MPFLVFSYVKLWRNMKNVQCILLLKLSRRKNPLSIFYSTSETNPINPAPEVLRRITDCIRVWSKTWVSKNGSGNRGSLGSLVQIIQIWFETSWVSLFSWDCMVHTYERRGVSKAVRAWSFGRVTCLQPRNNFIFYCMYLYVLSHIIALWVCLQVAQYEACNTGMYACWHLLSSTSNYRIWSTWRCPEIQPYMIPRSWVCG